MKIPSFFLSAAVATLPLVGHAKTYDEAVNGNLSANNLSPTPISVLPA